MVFAILTVIPALTPKYILFLFITIPCFSYYAVTSLMSFIRIVAGEQLVKNQRRHTAMILLSTDNIHSGKY